MTRRQQDRQDEHLTTLNTWNTVWYILSRRLRDLQRETYFHVL